MKVVDECGIPKGGNPQEGWLARLGDDDMQIEEIQIELVLKRSIYNIWESCFHGNTFECVG